ncbi:MAG TPA: trypsin-like peptidase domain-containing protein, partial [Candidatus Rifleibacterium sp.]|nr:trypsin-like peptidase domain-containing protein [Candidatus Rifleibacterium sp.]
MRKIVVFLSAIFFSFATQAVADSTDMKSYMQELQNLSRLKASGELSADEYNTRREELKTRYLKTSEAEKKPVSPKRSDSENKPTPKNETVKPDLVSGNQASQHQAKQPGNEIQKVIDATVQIEIFDKAGSKRGSGSGFIVDPTGIIVTNNHVLNNAASVLIRLANGDTYKDLMVRDFDEVKDLAIIKISGFDLPTVKLGNSSSLKGGEKILTCGFSLGEYANTVSDGLISGVRQNEKGYRYLQISAPISPGNSGGPVISETGEVIGVSTATNLEGQNLNFAVPINYVLGMLENDKKMTLTQYSSVCGQTMEHLIIDAKRSDEQLAHPDA